MIQIGAEALLPVLRSVAYRLQEAYNSDALFYQSATALWAADWLRACVEWVENGDPTSLLWSIKVLGHSEEVRLGEKHRDLDDSSGSEQEPAGPVGSLSD